MSMSREVGMKHLGTAYGTDRRAGQKFEQRYATPCSSKSSHKICEMRVRRFQKEELNEAQLEIELCEVYDSGRSSSKHFSVTLRGADLQAFIDALSNPV